MNWKQLALTAAAGTALLAAAPAFADPHWGSEHGWRARPHHPHYYRAPAYYYVPARPMVVAPPAYFYAPPPPVFYGQFPIGPDVRVSFGVRF